MIVAEGNSSEAFFGWNGHGVSPVVLNWTIRTSEVVVNWSGRHYQSFGASPGNPEAPVTTVLVDEYHGEVSYANVAIDGAILASQSGILLESRGGVEFGLSVRELQNLSIVAAENQNWVAGERQALTPQPSTSTPTTQVHPVTVGLPLTSTISSHHAQAIGDFDAIVWGGRPAAILNVTDPTGRISTYRSGEWWENATATDVFGERGASGDQYDQLIVLKLRNATLDLVQNTGLSAWTSPRLHLDGAESVRFDEARVYLESNQYYYAADNSSVEIKGNVTATIVPSATSLEELDAIVEAEKGTISLPPSGRFTPTDNAIPPLSSAAAGPKPETQTGSDSFVTIPLGSDSAWYLLGVAVLAGGLVYLVLAAWRAKKKVRSEIPSSSPPSNPDGQPPPESSPADISLLERAADALGRHDSGEARRLSEEHLRSHPEDADVLLILAASYAQQGAHSDVVRVLEPHASRSPDTHPSLAYLLSLSYAKLGDPSKAVRWLLVAAKDPELRPHIDQEPAFQGVRTEPVYRRLLGTDGANAAYV